MSVRLSLMYTLRNRKTGRKSARRRFTEARRTSQTAVYPHLDERVNRLSQHRGRARKRRGSELRGRDSQIAGQGSVDNSSGSLRKLVAEHGQAAL